VQDYCNAVSYVLTRPDVDPDRVGVVGVCMGGGYAVSVAARDKRVKAVASVAGGYDIGGTFQRFLGVDGFAAYYSDDQRPRAARVRDRRRAVCPDDRARALRGGAGGGHAE
jgi:dienelactone hydrolase